MTMPLPNENHKRLHRFAGEWSGPERLSATPFSPAGTAIGRYSGRIDMDGFFVIQDYVQERDGRVTYRGHGIFGWDTDTKTSTRYWVDSMGLPPPSPSRGTWTGDTIVFEYEDRGPSRRRYTCTFHGADTYDFKIENSQDGGSTWHTFMEATYRRSA